MLIQIAAFELRYQLRNPVFWVTAAIFFLLTFGAVTIDNVQIGGGGNVLENSPYATAQKHLILSVFFMFVTTAFVAGVIVRDDDTGFGPIVRSTRVTKGAYLYGRFIGAVSIAALGFLVVPFAIWIGSLMPWLDPETLGPNRLGDYAFAYGLLALPNVVVTAAFFFALATVTRSMMGTYVGVVAFLVLFIVITVSLGPRPELERALSIGDPFGVGAFEMATRYMTAAERNAAPPAFAGLLLWNRLLWLGLAAVALALAFPAFRFSDKGERRRRRDRSAADAAAQSDEPKPRLDAALLPAPRFGRQSAWAQFWTRTRFEMHQVIVSPAFGVLLALGLFNAFGGLWMSGEMFGTPTLPLTFSLLPVLDGTFTIIPVIIAIYYAGELVWRERDWRTHEIVDATPVPNWAYLVPKTAAVTLVLFAAVLIGVVAAIAVQLLKGFTDIRLGQYFLWHVLPTAWDVTLLAVLAVFLQSISPNKYVGWGLMVLFLISGMVLPMLGYEHYLYRYGASPEEPLSDMNGAGIYWIGAWWLRLYWGAFAILLLVGAHLLWRRGTETRLRPRLRQAGPRLSGSPGLIAVAGLFLFVASGSWIFYNTNVLNDYRTALADERFLAEYERRYLAYEDVLQPSVTHVEFYVDLHPNDIRAEIYGRYELTNLQDQVIDTVHVRAVDRDLDILALEFPGATLEQHDEEFGYRIYRLNVPLQPGDATELTFEARREQRGFRNSGADTRLVPNGTFLNNIEFSPAIGMRRAGLLQDRAKRRRHGLPPELRPSALEDLSATRQNYIGGDWTTADITIETVADQTPIAPGQRISDEIRDGRRIARFVSEAPILPFFSIQSARYEKRAREHHGVELSVYFHPAHHWNVERMLDALAVSLDYFSQAFAPYQFEQARIIEFPGYARFAQAFANTMPYSEAIGFIADNSDPEVIDYVTYVTAHEMAHQWWAHQVVGADMQGATMLSETLAQYSALMVMREVYGEDQIRRFLRYELDQYLRNRGAEVVEEVPLIRVENQGYIHYRKGSLVMYLLQERMGTAAVNRALARLAERYRFRGAPYPRSVDLVELLREEADTPELQALITDLFERITLYDLRVEQPTATERADGRWDVSVPVVARKFYADGQGRETEAPLDEAIEIGLFTEEPGRSAFDRSNVLMMQRMPVATGSQTFHFVTDQRPTHAGIDPYNFYIDRISADNVQPVN